MSQSTGQMKESQIRILNKIKGTQLPVSIVLMEASLEIGQLMALNPGGVMEFDHPVDRPAVMKINDRPFAQGKVVQAGENYGLELTAILGGES